MVILRWLLAAVFLVVFTIFAFVIYLALQERASTPDGAPPLVTAEGLPYKVEPVERGGLAVLNEDSSLVRALDQGRNEAVVELILPPPEPPPRSGAEVLAPQPRPDELAGEIGGLGDQTGSASAGVAQGVLSVIEARAENAEPESIGPLSVTPLESSEPDASVREIEGVFDDLARPNSAIAGNETPQAPAPGDTQIQSDIQTAQNSGVRIFSGPGENTGGALTVPPATSPPAQRQPATQGSVTAPQRTAPATDRFRVQLAAVGDEEQAQRAWNEFRALYPGVLGDGELFVVRVETTGGVFYRVQAGQYGARADALAACNAIQSQGGDCFVVQGDA